MTERWHKGPYWTTRFDPVREEYVPVPYSYNPYPNISTFHYRNPPVYGANLDQLQGVTPGLYARPFESKANFFYK